MGRRAASEANPGSHSAQGSPARRTEQSRKRRRAVAAAPVVRILVRTNAELVHELEVRQVQLRIQNDTLRAVRLDLAAAHDRFDDLYDAAPVGYFTLDMEGLVTQANLTGATLLGTARDALRGHGFTRFVESAHVERWLAHLQQVWQAGGARRVELVLRKASEEVFHGQLDCVTDMPAHGAASLQITLTDITQRKLAEMDRRIASCAQDTLEVERRHVAREMHEGLGQRLSVLKMELASLPPNIDAEGGRDRVGRMLESLDDAVTKVRRIVLDLRPMMLDDLGLPAAIDWLAHDIGRRMGLSVHPTLPELVRPVDDRTAIAMYRMAQVVLEHVARATGASGVAVSLAQHPAELILCVRCMTRLQAFERAPAGADDTPQIRGLHYRARSFGAWLEITDRPGGGLSIAVHMPVRRQGAPSQLPQAQVQQGRRREGRSGESKRESS